MDHRKNNQDTPQLKKPGSGLPWWQQLLSRYYYLPRYFKNSSWNDAIGFYQKEFTKILKAATKIQPELRNQRVLVSNIMGIEDSSRFWSVDMTIEHLNITNTAIVSIIESLISGKTPDVVLTIADLKPKEHPDATALMHEFDELYRKFISLNVREKDFENHKSHTHPHPWFEEFNAHQWLCLAAIHMNTHRKQIDSIIISQKQIP